MIHDSVLVPGPGDDRVELKGCEFAVSISSSGADHAVRVDLCKGEAVGEGHDVLVNANGLWNGSIVGSPHDDTLIAGDPSSCGGTLVGPALAGIFGDDNLCGGPVDDWLIGGAGVDLAVGKGGEDRRDAEVVRGCEALAAALTTPIGAGPRS